jgi:1,4-alpha-glucan branching enzyme
LPDVLGSFTFILHTHLPYVLHHGKWPHGSDWLSEAVAECYIPILEVLERLDQDGLAPRISMDFSPINLEQLADPAFQDVFVAYCDEKIQAAEKDFDYFKKNKEEELRPLAAYWHDFYTRTKSLFTEKYQCDIAGGFRKLSDKGILDAMTCGATHGYFPLLLRDANIRAQLLCAIGTHEQHFGKRPRGIWIPECGYRPRYKWSPPVGSQEYRKQVEERAGVEELLAEVGLEYFVVDGALTRGGVTVPSYQPFAKTLHEQYLKEIGPRGEEPFTFDPNRSLAEIYWVKSTSLDLPGPAPAVFSRDPQSASRVWAADLGYPGAGVYLDFHKKHHNSGLRYWSVTGSRVDLADKTQYNPEHTDWQLEYDAADFVSLIRRELQEHLDEHGHPGIIASPFDTELFGHWWFEGPRFLEKVMRRLNSSDEVKLTDCAQALDDYTYLHQTIALPEGSWGEGGHHYVWANQQVAWMWDVIYPLEDRFLTVLRTLRNGNALEEDGMLSTIMQQAARELLLLESSDWQFVISTQGAIEYSKERFAEHADFLTRLLDMAERYQAGEGLNEDDTEILEQAIVKDRPFEKIDLSWWKL